MNVEDGKRKKVHESNGYTENLLDILNQEEVDSEGTTEGEEENTQSNGRSVNNNSLKRKKSPPIPQKQSQCSLCNSNSSNLIPVMDGSKDFSLSESIDIELFVNYVRHKTVLQKPLLLCSLCVCIARKHVEQKRQIANLEIRIQNSMCNDIETARKALNDQVSVKLKRLRRERLNSADQEYLNKRLATNETSLKDRISQLNSELSEFRQRDSELKERVSVLKRQIDGNDGQKRFQTMEKVRDNAVNAQKLLQRKTEELQRRISDKDEIISSLRRENERLAQVETDLNTKLKRTEEEEEEEEQVRLIKVSKESVEIEELKTKYENAKRKLEDQNVLIESNKTESKRRMDEIIQLQRQISSLKNSVSIHNDSSEIHSSLTGYLRYRTLSILNDDIQRLEKTLRIKDDEIEELREEVRMLSRKLALMKEQNVELSSNHEQLYKAGPKSKKRLKINRKADVTSAIPSQSLSGDKAFGSHNVDIFGPGFLKLDQDHQTRAFEVCNDLVSLFRSVLKENRIVEQLDGLFGTNYNNFVQMEKVQGFSEKTMYTLYSEAFIFSFGKLPQGQIRQPLSTTDNLYRAVPQVIQTDAANTNTQSMIQSNIPQQNLQSSYLNNRAMY